jgi:hypothetical protein
MATAFVPNEHPSPRSLADLADVEATLDQWFGGQTADDRIPPPPVEPIQYRRHRCERRHRMSRTMADCVWPWAVWIAGNGPFATVSQCSHGPERRSMTTVLLHSAVDAARDSLATIDGGGCGGQCTGKHKLIELVLDDGGQWPRHV